MRSPKLVSCLFTAAFGLGVILSVSCVCGAQTESATISGRVTDSSGAVIIKATVDLQSADKGTIVQTTTNDAGIYVFPSVHPGVYHITVRKDGFKTEDFVGLTANVQDHLEQNFRLVPGAISESITVTAGAFNVNTTDATVSTVVDRTYVQNMPLNGRSFQDLILLTPGVVTNSPQTAQVLGNGGEFSVNGQRTEENYYTVDGVSASTGVDPVNGIGPGASGSVATATALGTTQALVSVDALQEFRVQSSTYSAEYGRTPGGQFSFVTRSGTNEWHGTAFDYLRNDILDANNWFNGYYGEPKPPLRQNDFGGTFGGPVAIPHLYNGKDKTFFFLSYEGLRAIQPQAATINYVPDMALRQATPAPLQQVFNAFPVPNGQSLGNGLAEFISSWSNPSSLDAYSIRLDHTFNNKLNLFFRFSDTPSNVSSRGTGTLQTPSTIIGLDVLSRTYTVGAASLLSNRLSNDFRLNYSYTNSKQVYHLDNFGGAEPIDLAQLQGTGLANPYQIAMGFFIGGYLPELNQGYADVVQKQWNVVDTAALLVGKHQLKFGIDYRRFAPLAPFTSPNDLYLFFSSADAIANNIGLASVISSNNAYPLFKNFSTFMQDEWRATPRLSLSMGLRWEVNPAPGVSKGFVPYALDNIGNWASLSLAPQGTPLWKTTWLNFAPRLGVAYVLRQKAGYETVLRVGAGLFFDTGQQLGAEVFSGAEPGFTGFGLYGSLVGVPVSFPLPVAQSVPAIINPPLPPFGPMAAFPHNLQLPYTTQWNVTVEQGLGQSQVLRVSYVGSHAARLLQEKEVNVAPVNPNFNTVYIFQNGTQSDYDAFQFQFQRKLAAGLTALASYSWSHSIDYGSMNFFLPYQRGNSDFDVRHNFSGAASYDLPAKFTDRLGGALLNHWGIDDRFTARSGFPVTLLGNTLISPTTGQFYYGGLNLVAGQPTYTYGAQYPGGRAINPAAFTPVTNPGDVGNAPRNFVRGFGAWQMDLGVRREFPIYDRLRLQFRAEAFNVFNHPNFGAINSQYGQTTFGQATATLNTSLGVLNPLFQMGGPRSMQFALKLVF